MMVSVDNVDIAVSSVGQGKEESGFSRMDFIDFIDNLPHGLLILDASLRVVTCNRALESLTGYGREDVIGVKGEAVLRSSLSLNGNPLGEVLRFGEKVAIEGDLVNRDRRRIPVRFAISPFRSRSKEVDGVAVYVEDVSLLKDLGEKAQGFPGLSRLVGHSAPMQEIFDMLPVVARTDASVLITGETGTGKDFVAEAVHKASRRAKHPFIKLNCGALPESLLESELFGHVRGAFTGADRDKPGMFRLADGGTIFLTEIGDLPLPLQVKLLTVLDDREFFPVGGSRKVKVDVRIITATHRDLAVFVHQGRFREDLFYRLNVLRLHLPALRDREDDVRLLGEHFLKEFCRGLSKRIEGFSDEVLAWFSAYGFPGNVRELRNIIEYAANLCDSEKVEMSHLPPAVLKDEKKGSERGLSYGSVGAAGDDVERLAGKGQPGLGWKDVERRMILDALAKTGGRRTKAAELLGWGRSTLWRKIKDYGLV